jgi:HrpA-like RNA helicase
MSATLNTDILSEYFEINIEPIDINTLIYPIDIHFADDLKKIIPNSYVKSKKFRFCFCCQPKLTLN